MRIDEPQAQRRTASLFVRPAMHDALAVNHHRQHDGARTPPAPPISMLGAFDPGECESSRKKPRLLQTAACARMSTLRLGGAGGVIAPSCWRGLFTASTPRRAGVIRRSALFNPGGRSPPARRGVLEYFADLHFLIQGGVHRQHAAGSGRCVPGARAASSPAVPSALPPPQCLTSALPVPYQCLTQCLTSRTL